jgi:hypothetical protein
MQRGALDARHEEIADFPENHEAERFWTLHGWTVHRKVLHNMKLRRIDRFAKFNHDIVPKGDNLLSQKRFSLFKYLRQLQQPVVDISLGGVFEERKRL